MPVFAAPMMFASFPVMPAAATRSAEPEYRSSSDCHERLNRLEQNVLELTQAMRELQAIVGDQSRVLDKITQELKPIKE
jgi:t-SNARE complex subunit (syntaxin)